ncbi:conjugal transfer protein TraO [Chryseobacterium gallinarum]|uniref:conjugal transfer protein TraO n=1 Tax=Chryseobacterium gallinarum TaxID=1324352 RepID=UPI002024E584|nr:conjugal transfer protein TraO [Chryseobacterium gallinarum]MCL8537658.1 conjugal transfer protein TraO [Chryseobacterium gallinarum]
MKKYFYMVTLMICVTVTTVNAQRLLPGQKGIEISWGGLSTRIPSQDYFLNIGLSSNGKYGNYWLWSFEYTHRNSPYDTQHETIQLPVETYSVQGGRSFYLLGDFRKTITLNFGVMAIAGYESINRGAGILPDGARIEDKNGFIYGAGSRLSLEMYLSNRFVFLLKGGINILWGTSIQQIRPGAGIGLRFNF